MMMKLFYLRNLDDFKVLWLLLPGVNSMVLRKSDKKDLDM